MSFPERPRGVVSAVVKISVSLLNLPVILRADRLACRAAQHA
jgi:hypothetical protein